MHQTWGKLLFMHWRIDAKLLRPLIPDALEIDTFDGTAWIAIAPFTMWDIRAFPPFIPPLPGLSSAHELNVRTYVHYDRVPGVWFFSLDCNSAAAVLGARTFFPLAVLQCRHRSGRGRKWNRLFSNPHRRAAGESGSLLGNRRDYSLIHIRVRSSFSSLNAIASTAKTTASSIACASTIHPGHFRKRNWCHSNRR